MLDSMSQPQDKDVTARTTATKDTTNSSVRGARNNSPNSLSKSTSDASEDVSPQRLLVSTLAISLLGLGIVALVGALFSSSPWWPLESMRVASSYLALTLGGLTLLVLSHGASVNYVHGNRKITAVWTGVLLVVAAVTALFVAFTHPTLAGSINLGAPRIFWLVLGIVLLGGGVIFYRPASRTQGRIR